MSERSTATVRKKSEKQQQSFYIQFKRDIY